MTRWLDEDFSKLPNGLHIYEAPQSCNKTGSIASLEGKMSLLVCARNSLLGQIKDRLPETIRSIHYYFDEEGKQRYYEDYELYLNRYGYGINYHSLKKRNTFHGKHTQKHEYLIIDEPFLIMSASTDYKPDLANELQYRYLQIHTPKVIYLGADFPEYLLNEIDEIGKLRNDREIDPDEPDFIIEDDSVNPFEDMYDEDLAEIRENIGKW